MPAIYYMRIFMSGYGAQGQMISNNDPEVESIRKHMIAHVCNELNWSSEYWDQFHASIAALRNEIVAHFDATNAHFDKDNKGYGVKHVLMNPEIRAEFKKVITSMTKYISMFKVHED